MNNDAMNHKQVLVPAERRSAEVQDQIEPAFQPIGFLDTARFRALAAASADVVFVTNAHGTRLKEYPGWRAFTGQEPTNDKDWDWLHSFHPGDGEHLKALCQQTIALKEMMQGEVRLRRHDGLDRICHLKMVPVLDGRGEVYECLGVGTDITAHKQVEENHAHLLMQQKETRHRLETARARLQAVLDVLPVGVCIADDQGRLTHMNAAAKAIWGKQIPYATSLTQYSLYQGWWTNSGQVMAPEEWGMARAIQGGEVSLAEEIDILSFDGQRKTMLHYAAPIRDEGGPIIGGVVAILDITERKRLEKVLVERISQLEAVLEAMADGVFVYDQEGQIVQMNTAAGELLFPGVDIDFAASSLQERLAFLQVRDVQGQPLSQQDWPVQRILHGEVLRERNAVDVLLRSLDGRELQVRISGAPMRDKQGKVIGAVSIGRDVTERRRLEQLERRMHEQTEARLALLQLILDQLPGSVFLVQGANARLVLANRAATVLFGACWQRGEALEHFLSTNSIRLLGTNGQPLPFEHLSTVRVVLQGEKACQQQETIRRADGTTLPMLVNAVALDPADLNSSQHTSQQGEEVGERAALVVSQDVTALREAEALKDEFIAIAAHELRTPLAALQGFAQMLMMQATRERRRASADWQLEGLQEIEQAAVRLSELTEDLLDVTRLQAGRLVLQPEPTDLVALARRVIKRMQITSERHSLTLFNTLPYIVVDADSHRLEQVLTNLIGNAIKYSPQGGSIEITIGQRETYEAVLSVRDHGIGIPAKQQGHIFSRFMRADNARTSGISGTGLGLYLCRELIELHCGRIWFESVEEQGSVFFIALPCPSQ